LGRIAAADDKPMRSESGLFFASGDIALRRIAGVR
jgi:hypothetical protein